MAPDPVTSHGRGGAGNIRPDPNTYTDGGIVREGPTGDQGDGAYSAGRGGAGNIGSPLIRPTNPRGTTGDSDVVPETAIRRPGEVYDKYHVGRGGEGNIHRKDKAKLSSLNTDGTAPSSDKKENLMDKVKEKVGLGGHKKDEARKSLQ